MKYLPFVTLLIGGALGYSVASFKMMKPCALKPLHEEKVSEVLTPELDETDTSDNSDPFAETSSQPKSHSDISIDLTNRNDRDMLISLWYLAQQDVVSLLEHHTNQKFTPVGKVHASPQQILQEQSQFLAEFEVESSTLDYQN